MHAEAADPTPSDALRACVSCSKTSQMRLCRVILTKEASQPRQVAASAGATESTRRLAERM
eukprot:2550603-Pleurochrysis_carterae.AAC.2